MRIVIDMQGVQTQSHFKSIGGSAMAFTQAIVRNKENHEVFLALSGLFPHTIEPIRNAFYGLLPQENIRVWNAPGPVKEVDSPNSTRREVAELVREAFIASLLPDIIHISSLFEGYLDDAVTSIGILDKNTPVSVACFDFINMPNTKDSMGSNECFEKYYRRKIENLKKATFCLVNSEITSKNEMNDVATSEFKFFNLAPNRAIKPIGDDHLLQSESTIIDYTLTSFNDLDSEYWDECAVKALSVFSSFLIKKASTSSAGKSHLPRLAFVSPLPPERTGIADYSAELLTSLANYYDIEVIVTQEMIEDVSRGSEFSVRDINWLRANINKIDRVCYHIGNSHFHQHMLFMLRDIPGVVVLHDFYLCHLMAHMDQHVTPHFLANMLYESHGYNAVRKRFLNLADTLLEYPANFEVLKHAIGIIVHSKYSRTLAQQWYGNKLASDWAEIPLLRSPAFLGDKADARKNVGLAEDDFVICSFGHLGLTKLNHRLVEAWLKSNLAANKQCKLIFVGEISHDEYGRNLLRAIQTSGLKDRILITGFVPSDKYYDYLIATDMAVQLRTHSRGETSAAVLDCMNYSLPLIVNANGALSELNNESVLMLPDVFTETALVDALEFLWRNPDTRNDLAKKAHEHIKSHHTPNKCAEQYSLAIEKIYAKPQSHYHTLINSIANIEGYSPTVKECEDLAQMISCTLVEKKTSKQLFVDVSTIYREDLKTGIQRVVRSIVLELINLAPINYRIEPVYLSNNKGMFHYCYARKWTSHFLDITSDWCEDETIEYVAGDALLVADYTGKLAVEAENSGYFTQLKNDGVAINFIVYDLLPIKMPEFFPPVPDDFQEWLNLVCRISDNAICISSAVALDLKKWIDTSNIKRAIALNIDWIHLGADVESSAPTFGLPKDIEQTIQMHRDTKSFLMVGTIEPRKGYLQTIDAFTRLWEDGAEINLIIVGNEGWKSLPNHMRRSIPLIINRIRNHKEFGKRLFWHEGISDEYLEKLYGAATCLIAASEGEGFGLPLIEAAQNKLPVICRDIPVFREVAGEHAYYFSANNAEQLAVDINRWLVMYVSNEHPQSNKMPWQTWKQSAAKLLNCININKEINEPV